MLSLTLCSSLHSFCDLSLLIHCASYQFTAPVLPMCPFPCFLDGRAGCCKHFSLASRHNIRPYQWRNASRWQSNAVGGRVFSWNQCCRRSPSLPAHGILARRHHNAGDQWHTPSNEFTGVPERGFFFFTNQGMRLSAEWTSPSVGPMQ